LWVFNTERIHITFLAPRIFEVAHRFLESLSIIGATATTVTVVTTVLIITNIVITIIIIIIIIILLPSLPDLAPQEDLYGNRKCLVIEAVVQGAASLHLRQNR
jgi:hypothetical protein